jgi:Caspase domain
MAQKVTLLIGSSDYAGAGLSQLKRPPLDVEGLAGALRDPGVGGFEPVHALVNEPLDVVRRSIFDLFEGRGREDLVLLYISGHGLLNLQSRLFFAVSNTEFDRLSITALPGSEVQERMNESRSRRQVLILDCCHSGAFYREARRGTQLALTGQTFEARGRLYGLMPEPARSRTRQVRRSASRTGHDEPAAPATTARGGARLGLRPTGAPLSGTAMVNGAR